jgi:hypothetical protein
MKTFREYTESTAEYAKSLEKIANDRKMKNISKKDRETLKKIAALMANEDLEEAKFDVAFDGFESEWLNLKDELKKMRIKISNHFDDDGRHEFTVDTNKAKLKKLMKKFGDLEMNESTLNEKPLTPQQRMQRGRIMKRLAPKLAMKRKQAMKKKASPEKLKQRAEKQAKEILRKKFSGKADYNSMSFAQKIQVDKKVEAKKALIKKIAKKLMPKIKQQEIERIKALKQETAATYRTN